MFGKCKVHDVDLVLEESRQYPGRTYPICRECRKELADRFKGSFAAQKNVEWPHTPTNSESDAITCAECIHTQCPLREFGIEFNRVCYEGRRK